MTVSVGDITAMSDTEPTQSIDQNRTPDGEFDLRIHNRDKLSKEECGYLAERLNAQNRAIAQSPAAYARPLDLDQVDGRLQEVLSADNSNTTSSRDRLSTVRRTRSPIPVIKRDAKARVLEAEIYNDLVIDGGRPLYPIGLLNEIFQNLEEYDELLRPWKLSWCTNLPWKSSDSMDEPREIFQRQLARWQDFRKWQNDNRGIEDDTTYPAYVESVKLRHRRFRGEESYICLLAKLEDNPSYLEKDWDRDQELRDLQRSRCRENRGGNGFPGYVEAVKRRLARHGFTRPFQLKYDPKRQDKLTEWIEYLNFEYWCLDWYAASIQRLKPAHDKAWRELVDSKIARPGETMESIRTTASSMQRSREQSQAREAMRRAKSRVKEVYTSTSLAPLAPLAPNRLNTPMKERSQRLQAATRELLAAEASKESIIKRGSLIEKFIRGTSGFVDAKKDASRHSILVQWVLDQVPLVEAELTRSEATKVKPDETKRRAKRRLDSNDDDLEGRGSGVPSTPP
ncbi:hypothetical protein GGS24DRAFT_518539 [Hypoxylon argillaceum]|nr:hypothetical protein GGS24DRAFT_518539 [Hypoxylon argillaceum]